MSTDLWTFPGFSVAHDMTPYLVILAAGLLRGVLAIDCSSYDGDRVACSGCVAGGECVYNFETDVCENVGPTEACPDEGFGVTELRPELMIQWMDPFDAREISYGPQGDLVDGEAVEVVRLTWSGVHDVWRFPDEAAMDACDFTAAEELASTDSSSYVVDGQWRGDGGDSDGVVPRSLYLGCSVSDHCSVGNQKLTLTYAEAPASAPTSKPTEAASTKLKACAKLVKAKHSAKKNRKKCNKAFYCNYKKDACTTSCGALENKSDCKKVKCAWKKGACKANKCAKYTSQSKCARPRPTTARAPGNATPRP